MRILRQAGFHLRQFISVPYFIQLMVLTTVAATIVQYVGISAWDSITPTQGWLRAGIIGMWTTSTSAAGIIGFERYKGTLVYLLTGSMRPQFVLSALVSSAATFGLASFPVAWLTWAAMSGSVSFTNFADVSNIASILVGIITLYCGCLAVSLVISALFILTPNAISYEGLLLVPVFLASGVLMVSQPASNFWAVISNIIPLSAPVHLLMHGSTSLGAGFLWCAILVVWLVIGYVLIGRALRLAYQQGTLELV